MLFAGKLKMVCLLVGLLTISEIGIQSAAGRGTASQAEAGQDVETQAVEMQDKDVTGEYENRMLEEYERLEKEEKDLKSQLQEKESTLNPKDEAGQIEVMDLQEKVRTVQLQIMVLRARMEETF